MQVFIIHTKIQCYPQLNFMQVICSVDLPYETSLFAELSSWLFKTLHDWKVINFIIVKLFVSF